MGCDAADSVFQNSKFLFGGNTEPVRQRVDEDRQPSLSFSTIMTNNGFWVTPDRARVLQSLSVFIDLWKYLGPCSLYVVFLLKDQFKYVRLHVVQSIA